MAFWALGALDKIKNISIKEVTKKVKDYVVTNNLFSKLLLSNLYPSSNSHNNRSNPTQ